MELILALTSATVNTFFQFFHNNFFVLLRIHYIMCFFILHSTSALLSELCGQLHNIVIIIEESQKFIFIYHPV